MHPSAAALDVRMKKRSGSWQNDDDDAWACRSFPSLREEGRKRNAVVSACMRVCVYAWETKQQRPKGRVVYNGLLCMWWDTRCKEL